MLRLSVSLFGGRPGAAADAATRLVREITGLHIAGVRDGLDGAADTDAAVADVNGSGADVVLVAIGVPLQDVSLARNASRLHASVTLGFSALFDFLARRAPRGPQVLRRTKMEWVWRLAIDLRRMEPRYLVGNASFMLCETRNALCGASLRALIIQSKRLVDVTIAAVTLMLLAPLFILVIAAMRLESQDPVMFRQTRIGKAFTIFKFRLMDIDAETRRAGLLGRSDRNGICFKSRNDPLGGRLLRRFSIDDLRQIFNVSRGDMLMVRPRPALPEKVAAYPPRALSRLAVKPGLTGIWLVLGRAKIGFDQMSDTDLAYTWSQSLLLDLVLIAMPFRGATSGRGAY